VYLATEHDSVYAFDADAVIAEPLWHANFLDASKGVGTVSNDEVRCPFISPEVGISSTPVIDANNSTIYVLARTKEWSSGSDVKYVQKLHALSIADGTEKSGSPVEIHASLSYKEFWFFNAHLDFNPLRENQRAALLLSTTRCSLPGLLPATWCLIPAG
jgi:hypothetical protein